MKSARNYYDNEKLSERASAHTRQLGWKFFMSCATPQSMQHSEAYAADELCELFDYVKQTRCAGAAAASAGAAAAAYAHNFKLHTAQWHQHNKSAKGPSD